MTLKEEVLELFAVAKRETDSKMPAPGTSPRDGDPDPRWATININNEAIAKALMKIADRVDALENRQ